MDLPAELGQMLTFMRKRPGMFFLDGAYLRGFSDMAHGYGLCSRVNGCADPLALGDEFALWVVKKLRIGGGTATGWIGVLRRKYPDDCEAYDRFFDLLAEYRGWPELKLRTNDPISGASEPGTFC